MAEDRRRDVDELGLDDDALEALAEAYATPPAPTLAERVLAEARRDLAVRRVRGPLRRWRVVGSIAAAAALALGVLLSRELQTSVVRGDQIEALVSANAELAARVDAQERDVASMRSALAAQAQALRVVGTTHTISIALKPSEGMSGTGRVLFDIYSGEAAVVLTGIPPAGADKVYELWAIRGDKPPEPAGLLSVGAEQALVAQVEKLKRPEQVSAFAVSIEPAGGSQTPRGPIVMVGLVAG